MPAISQKHLLYLFALLLLVASNFSYAENYRDFVISDANGVLVTEVAVSSDVCQSEASEIRQGLSLQPGFKVSNAGCFSSTSDAPPVENSVGVVYTSAAKVEIHERAYAGQSASYNWVLTQPTPNQFEWVLNQWPEQGNYSSFDDCTAARTSIVNDFKNETGITPFFSSCFPGLESGIVLSLLYVKTVG